MVRKYAERNKALTFALVVVVVFATLVYMDEIKLVEEKVPNDKLSIISVSEYESELQERLEAASELIEEPEPDVAKVEETPEQESPILTLPPVPVALIQVFDDGTEYAITPTRFEGWYAVEGKSKDVEINVLRGALPAGTYTYEVHATGAMLVPVMLN